MSSRRSFFDFLRTASKSRTAEGRIAREAIAQGRHFTCTSIHEWMDERGGTADEHEAIRVLVLEYLVGLRYSTAAECPV